MEENKEKFIKEIEKFIDQLSPEAITYFNYIRSADISAPELTENGKAILTYMIQNRDRNNNVFKAKDIAEGLFVSTRSVSGSMQKLIKDGFCTKLGGTPVCYALTDKGCIVDI